MRSPRWFDEPNLVNSEDGRCDLISDGHPHREADRVFRALGDATRRDILVCALREEQSVSELALRYDMSFAAVQKHVAVLERAGLIIKRARGRERVVNADLAVIQRASQLLRAYEDLGHERSDDDLSAAPARTTMVCSGSDPTRRAQITSTEHAATIMTGTPAELTAIDDERRKKT